MENLASRGVDPMETIWSRIACGGLGLDQEKVTVLSETYVISLGDTSDNDITLVQDMEMNHSVEDSSEAGSSTETQSCDDQDFTEIRQNVTDELEFCKSSLHMELDDDNYKEQVELPPDLNKFFGLGMPLTKSYATFAQKRRNKRLYLPVPSKLKCNKCYFRTQSHFALKLHIEQNHSDKTWYLCMSCDHTSDTEASMREHVETSIMLESLQFLKSDINDNLSISDKLLKMNDKRKDRSKNNLKKRLIHNGGYICIRGKTNDNQQNIGFSKSNDKRSNEEAAMILSSEKSKNIDKFKNVLGVREKLNVSYAALAPKKNSSGNGNSKIKCSKCYFRTGSEESLKAHMKEIHFRENLLTCPLCDYTASDETILNCHLEGHPDVKRFKCPLCEFLTTSKNNFEVHTIKCHLKRYYFCSVCDFGTFELSEFTAHKIIHPPPPTPRTIYRNVNFPRRSIKNIDQFLQQSDENQNLDVSTSSTEANLKHEFPSTKNENSQLLSVQNQSSKTIVHSFRIVKAIENYTKCSGIERSNKNVSLKRSIQYCLDNNNQNKKQCSRYSSNIKLDGVCNQLKFKNVKNDYKSLLNINISSDKSNRKYLISNNKPLCKEEYLKNKDSSIMNSRVSSNSILKNENLIASHFDKVPEEKIQKSLSEMDKNISENQNNSNLEAFGDLLSIESSSKLDCNDVEKKPLIFDELIDPTDRNIDEKSSKCSSENDFELVLSSDRSIGEIKSSNISSHNDMFDSSDKSIDKIKLLRSSTMNYIELIDSSDKSIGENKLASSSDNYSCDELIDTSDRNIDERITSKCSSENDFELIHLSDRSIGEIKSSNISSQNDMFDSSDKSIDKKNLTRSSTVNYIEFIDSSDKSICENKSPRSSSNNYSCDELIDSSDKSIYEIEALRKLHDNDKEILDNADHVNFDEHLKNSSSFKRINLVESKNSNDEFDDYLNIEDNIIAKLVEVMSESSDIMNSDGAVSHDMNFFNLFEYSEEANSEFSINDDEILSNFFQSMDDMNYNGDKCEMNLSGSHKVDLDLSESHKVDLDLSESLKLDLDASESHKLDLDLSESLKLDLDLSESHKADLDSSENHKMNIDLSESHKVLENSNISNIKEALNVNSSCSLDGKTSFLTNFEDQDHNCSLNLSNIGSIKGDVLNLTEDNCSLNLIDMINYDDNYLKRLTENTQGETLNGNLPKMTNSTFAQKLNVDKILDNFAQSSSINEPDLQENRSKYPCNDTHLSMVNSLSNIGVENLENFNFLFDGITPCFSSSNLNICLSNNCNKDSFISDKGIENKINLSLSENDKYDVNLYSNGSQFELLYKFNNSFTNNRNKLVEDNDKSVDCNDTLMENQNESMKPNDQSMVYKDKPMKYIVQSEEYNDKLMEGNLVMEYQVGNDKLIEYQDVSMECNDKTVECNDALMERQNESMKGNDQSVVYKDKLMKYNVQSEEYNDKLIERNLVIEYNQVGNDKLMKYQDGSMECNDKTVECNDELIGRNYKFMEHQNKTMESVVYEDKQIKYNVQSEEYNNNSKEPNLVIGYQDGSMECNDELIEHNDKLVECNDELIGSNYKLMEHQDELIERNNQLMKYNVQLQYTDKLMEQNYKRMENNDEMTELNDKSIKSNVNLTEHDYKSMEQTDKPLKLIECNSKSMESYNKSIYKLTNGRFNSAISST